VALLGKNGTYQLLVQFFRPMCGKSHTFRSKAHSAESYDAHCISPVTYNRNEDRYLFRGSTLKLRRKIHVRSEAQTIAAKAEPVNNRYLTAASEAEPARGNIERCRGVGWETKRRLS
jgi:hypothetical protein